MNHKSAAEPEGLDDARTPEIAVRTAKTGIFTRSMLDPKRQWFRHGEERTAGGLVDDGWPAGGASRPAGSMLEELLSSHVIADQQWRGLPLREREELAGLSDTDALLHALAEKGLLTAYQATQARAGARLMIDCYRLLDRLGAGGMGVVLRAEHRLLRRPVALKILSQAGMPSDLARQRFETEIRVLAQLSHPHIVGIIDAGEVDPPRAGEPPLPYFVMEFVPGADLDEYVHRVGPLPCDRACDLVHQVATALEAAHGSGLLHRDIKPSNIRVTPEGRAKLLDFGLVRAFGSNLTEPGTILGSVDFIAPEQAWGDGPVDIRADLYGLGGTLFWCLTGRLPFAAEGSLVERLARRRHHAPPSVRAIRPDVPVDLDAVVARLLAVDPADRFQTPGALIRTLVPFLPAADRPVPSTVAAGAAPCATVSGPTTDRPGGVRVPRILLIDDEAGVRSVCRFALEAEGYECVEAADGLLGFEAALANRFDLVLLDVALPRMTGPDVCRRLRATSPDPHLKILMISGHTSSDEMSRMLSAGADDYLGKPLSAVQLVARVKSALRHRDAQDRYEEVHRGLLSANLALEQAVTARDSDLVHARNALVLALAKLAESRDSDTGAHLLRLQRFSRCLAEEASNSPVFAGQIDPNFTALLEGCAPLHDIGKVGLPDHILVKAGRLDPDERLIMQTHTVIGSETLRAVAERHGFARAFLQMAIEITRHHHERYDGRGYPDRLAGTDIPLAARIVAICDVYDALRSRRVYKPPMAHADVVQLMTVNNEGQFDPNLIEPFLRCAPRFEALYRESVA